MLLDKNRTVIDANRAARGIFGDHLLGHDLAHSLRHPAALAAASSGANQCIEFAMQVPVARRFEMHVMPLPPQRFDGCATVLVLLDVTSAHLASQMRADFVANVSHELRSPLASLLGFIETLQGPAKDDASARERFLKIMAGEASRMSRLIDDLLSLSRVQAQEHVRPKDSVDIDRLLGNICDAMRLRASQRGSAIELSCPPDLPEIAGDADQLQEVFQNLLDNAIKYGAPQTVITVTAQRIARVPETATAGIRVAVHNDGEPIAPEHLPRLTERFYRADKARSREIGGTGLGLAIVKHILNRHRGRLGIESAPGLGTTCTVLLPFMENPVI